MFLVFSKSKIQPNLVSDDTTAEGVLDNHGYTLPEKSNATHNASLSPLFLGRAGRVYGWDEDYIQVASQRGRSEPFWSAVTRSVSNAYVLWINTDDGLITPSYSASHVAGRTLRCLVSTNNRIMDKVIILFHNQNHHPEMTQTTIAKPSPLPQLVPALQVRL